MGTGTTGKLSAHKGAGVSICRAGKLIIRRGVRVCHLRGFLFTVRKLYRIGSAYLLGRPVSRMAGATIMIFRSKSSTYRVVGRFDVPRVLGWKPRIMHAR
jgi:hypothetical protein